MTWDSLLTFTETDAVDKNSDAIYVGSLPLSECLVKLTALTADCTLDITIEDSEDGETFAGLAQFLQFTAIGSKSIYIKTNKPYIRYVVNVTGTDAHATFKLRIG
jgi:hypothetical protein